jgi:hypothetical protein
MFWYYGIRANKWLWAHIVLAGVLFHLFSLFLADQLSFISVIVVAIGYEVVQFLRGEWKSYGIPISVHKEYGYETPTNIIDYWKKKIYWLDAIGDVLGALVMCVLLVI